MQLGIQFLSSLLPHDPSEVVFVLIVQNGGKSASHHNHVPDSKVEKREKRERVPASCP